MPSDAERRDAFRRIVEAHEERVYALALRLTASPDDAMELTQDTFLTAWRAMGTFRGESHLSTWLLGITVREARRRWRGLMRRIRREDRYARERYDHEVGRAMPGASIDLERAIGMLPERMRCALVLHCIEGLPQKEVARLMGVAVGTVKAHVHAAREELKQRLKT